MPDHDPARLSRDADGSARVRLRFTADEADAIERQAGEDDQPVMTWIFHMLLDDD